MNITIEDSYSACAVICSASICRPLFLFCWPFPADVASYRQYESHQPKRKKKGLSICFLFFVFFFFCFSACVSPITYCIVYTSHIYRRAGGYTKEIRDEPVRWENGEFFENEPRARGLRPIYYLSLKSILTKQRYTITGPRTGPSTSLFYNLFIIIFMKWRVQLSQRKLK